MKKHCTQKWFIIIPYILILVSAAYSQDDGDSLLFTIRLKDDTTSLFQCQWTDKVKTNLAGPVLMQNGSLLFFSQNGYVLYDKKGSILDSLSLLKKKGGEEKRYKLAYPLDSTTILLYSERPGKDPEVFQKKLLKRSITKIIDNDTAVYSQVNKSLLFNIACNSITDEMSIKSFLYPHLIGYTSLKGGIKWWSADKMYSFSSPLLVAQNEHYYSFFPGLKKDQHCDVKRHLIEPLGVFLSEGRWFYYGLYSSMGNTSLEYYQALILCDQAGNILSSDRLLKQEITDAVLNHNEVSNTNYTVRQAGRHVFVPAIDRKGFLYYGILNYEWKKIDVYQRAHRHYVAVPVKNNYEQKFIDEGNLDFSPIKLECGDLAVRGIRPEVIVTKGSKVDFLDNDQTTRKGFYVTIHRYTDENLKTKLSRIQSSLPEPIQKIQDSIAKTSTSWCPYTIGLNLKDKGEIAKLFYGFGDVIMCARVVEVTNSGEVYIRVDLDTWSEVLVFTTDGKYMSRFIFNRKPYEQRKDLIVISDNREIIERDYESEKSGNSYLKWELR
ncbi:MAG TPA: hypothetical protein VHO70_15500 [Chitinispirillaceae bacterium]|nr:hypothetical protein [Chitinispirillaceae bacterium]